MSTTAIRDQLRALSFLDGLTDSAYHQLARLVSAVRYQTDEYRGHGHHCRGGKTMSAPKPIQIILSRQLASSLAQVLRAPAPVVS